MEKAEQTPPTGDDAPVPPAGPLIPADRISELYHGEIFTAATAEIARDRIHWMCSQCTGESVLDVGCSQGIAAILLAREGFRVTGVDAHPEAIAYARKATALEAASVQERLTWVAGDLADIPVAEQFDTVILGEVIEHQALPDRFLALALRHVQSGGRIVLTTPFGLHPHPDHKSVLLPRHLVEIALEQKLHIEQIDVVDGYMRMTLVTTAKGTAQQLGDLRNVLLATEKGTLASQEVLYSRMQERSEQLKKKTEAGKTLEKRLAALEQKQAAELKVQAEQRQKLQREKTDAEQTLATRQQELSELRAQLAKAEQESRAVTEQSALLREKAEAELDRARQTVQTEQTQRHAGEKELVRVQEQLKHLQARSEEQRSQLEEAVVEQKHRLDVATETLATRQQALAELAAKLDETDRASREATALSAFLHERLTQAEAELAKTREDFATEETQRIAGEIALVRLQEQLKHQQVLIDSQKRNLERDITEKDALAKELDKALLLQRSEAAELRKKLAASTHACHAATEQSALLDKRIAQSEAEFVKAQNDARSKAAELRANLDEATLKLRDAAEQAELLKEQLAQDEAELDNVRNELGSVQAQRIAGEIELFRLHEQFRHQQALAETALQTRDRRIAALQESLERSRNEIEANKALAKEEHALLQRQLEDARSTQTRPAAVHQPSNQPREDLAAKFETAISSHRTTQSWRPDTTNQLTYKITQSGSAAIELTPNALSLPIDFEAGATYRITGRFIALSKAAKKPAIIVFEFSDSSDLEVIKKSSSLVYSDKWGFYRYLHPGKGSNDFEVVFSVPPRQKLNGVGIRLWGKPGRITIDTTIKVECLGYAYDLDGEIERNLQKNCLQQGLDGTLAQVQSLTYLPPRQRADQLEFLFQLAVRRDYGKAPYVLEESLRENKSYTRIRRLAEQATQAGMLHIPALLFEEERQAGRLLENDIVQAERALSKSRLLRDGFEIPARAEKTPYRIDPNASLYLCYFSLPYHSNGYATRTHGVLRALSKGSRKFIAFARPGYPWDINTSQPIHDYDVVDGIVYRHLNGAHLSRQTREEYFKTASQSIEAVARTHRASIIQAASNYLLAIPALLAARRLGIPFVYEVRGLWEITQESKVDFDWTETDAYRLDVMCESLLAQHADFLLPITEGLRKELIHRGAPKNCMLIAPNGVDIEQFSPLARNQALARQLGLADAPTIGFIGSFVDYEGLDDLILAANLLKQDGCKFNLLLVGNGYKFEELKQLVINLDLQNQVFMTGRVPFEQVGDYYSLIDIAPFPRKPLPVCEMVSPLKPFEAMAMEKAVVASDVGALAEIISHEHTGLLFNKGSVDDLAQKLRRLIEDPALVAKYGHAGRKWVQNERTWRHTAQLIEDVHERLTGVALSK